MRTASVAVHGVGGHADEITFADRKHQVTVERRDDGIAVMRHVGNILPYDVVKDLLHAFAELRNDYSLEAVVVCINAYGADINEFPLCPKDKRKGILDAREIIRNWHALAKEMLAFTKPIIGAIEGRALGGGFELGLMCDYTVAGKDEKGEGANIGLPEMLLGIMPGGGGTQTLARKLGIPKTLWIILSGKIFKARQPWVDCVTNGQAESVALEKAREGVRKKFRDPLKSTIGGWFAAWFVTIMAFVTWWGHPPASFWLARRAILNGNRKPLNPGGLNEEFDAIMEAFETEDAKEGVNIYFKNANIRQENTKRKKAGLLPLPLLKPRFKGK